MIIISQFLMRNLLARRNNWDVEDIWFVTVLSYIQHLVSFSDIGYLIKRLIHFFPALTEIEFLTRGLKQDDQWTFQSFCPEETDREKEREFGLEPLKWLKNHVFLNATNITAGFSSKTDHWMNSEALNLLLNSSVTICCIFSTSYILKCIRP